MTDELTVSSESDIWSSDVLGRKTYADFLTKYLVRKTTANAELRPFIIALDADWGAGKTYFITRWQEELNTNSTYPNFVFDAWKADYQADPLLTFISAFKLALDEYIDCLPSKKSLKVKAEEKLKSGLKQVQSALIPMAKHLAIGLANKATAGAIDAIVEDKNFDFNKFEKDSLGGLGDTLEKCFEKSLKEQAGREELFNGFKSSISQTLALLQEGGNFDLPFIIFIDEIDRCRPSFAVELLESLKHIFDIPGLCFVVSTNLEQLSHSVSGIYGTNFDGRNYLQRFFDVEYTLPAPDGAAYPKILVGEFFSQTLNLYLGLPERGFLGQSEKSQSYMVIEWISDAFNLDLRSQRKMVELIDAAIASVDQKHSTHFMWLAMLAAIKIKAPKLFDLIKDERLNHQSIKELWDSEIGSDVSKTVRLPDDGFGQRGSYDKGVCLKDVFLTYYDASYKELLRLSGERHSLQVNVYEYPDSILQKIVQEMPNPYSRDKTYFSSIKGYHNLISCAGHIF